jgi:hypothetical protein
VSSLLALPPQPININNSDAPTTPPIVHFQPGRLMTLNLSLSARSAS